MHMTEKSFMKQYSVSIMDSDIFDSILFSFLEIWQVTELVSSMTEVASYCLKTTDIEEGESQSFIITHNI